MKQGLYDNLSNVCKTTIKNNNPEDSINIIANMKLPGSSDKIGKDSAYKIYNLYSDKSVNYDTEQYKYNISSYKKKVKNNINRAKKYSQN
jgi:hypothetical protein